MFVKEVETNGSNHSTKREMVYGIWDTESGKPRQVKRREIDRSGPFAKSIVSKEEGAQAVSPPEPPLQRFSHGESETPELR